MAGRDNRDSRYSEYGSSRSGDGRRYNAQGHRNSQGARPQWNSGSQVQSTRSVHYDGSQKGRSTRVEPDRRSSTRRMDPRILGVLAVVLVLFVGVFAIGAMGQAQLGQQNVQASDTTDAGSADTGNAADQKEAASSTTPQSDNVNAVQLGNVPGSSEATDEKVVYLTFDDGPSDLTPQVLDILDKYNAKATFFVVGHSEDCFYLIAEEAKRGHTVGMHTYTHDYEQVYASDEAYFEDLDQIAQVVKEQIGYVPAYIRFPGGSSNSVSAKYCEGIMSRLVDSVHEKGYQYYDWNVSSGDGSNIETQDTIDNSIGHEDLNNIILLCHDSATKQSTVDALPSIIEYYQQLGYTFKGIDRQTYPAHHTPQN